MGLLRTSLLVVLSCTVMSIQAANFNQKKIKVNEPSFSSYFYSDYVGSVETELDDEPNFDALKKMLGYRVIGIESVVGYDWEKDHSENSNSLNVNHEAISYPARQLFTIAQAARASNDVELIGTSKRLILDIAKADTLSNTTTLAEVKAKGSAVMMEKAIQRRLVNFMPHNAMQFFGNYMVSASLMWPHLSKTERDVLTEYSDRMYKAYVRPIFDSLRKGKTRFSQMANGGIAVLAYAYLKNDSRLAQQTLNQIFQNIDTVFLDDGYIKGSSFRGVRGFWYHTYGVNSALAVVHLAKQWKVEIPEQILKKVTASAKLVNVGIADLGNFESRKSPTGRSSNVSNDPKDARPYVHPMAIAI